MKKAMKKMIMRKVLSCFVVFVILMSAFSVAVLATESTNDTDISTAKTVSSLGYCSYVWIEITDKYCKGYEVYVDGAYQFTEGESGTPDGCCGFKVTPGYHTFKLTLNGKEVSKGWNCQCGVAYNWMSMNDMIPHWCEGGGGGDCDNPPTVSFDKTKYYEGDTVHITVHNPISGQVVDYDIIDCEGNSKECKALPYGTSSIYYTLPTVSSCCYWKICFYWNEGQPPLGAGSYCSKCYSFYVCPHETPCRVWINVEDKYCKGYEVYVDDVYQFTEGESGTPDGYCRFWVTRGTHKFELRKDGCSVSKSWYCQCGTYYSWTSMNDMYPRWCECNKPTPPPVKEVKFRGTVIDIPSEGFSGGYWWNVKVDKWISGSLPCNTVHAYYGLYADAILGHYDRVQKGDEVEVYGSVDPNEKCYINLNGGSYYIKKIEKPDLIIQDIWWSPSNPKEGDTVTFCVEVKNQGSGTAGASYVYYYIDGSYVDSDYVSSLSAGSTSNQTFTWTANKYGNVQVKAIADATNTVTESNEGNNERTKTLSVTCLNHPPIAYIDSITPNPAIFDSLNVEESETISYSGHGTDPDGDSIIAYNWRSEGGTQLSTTSSFSISSNMFGWGSHTIYFKVKDSHNAWSNEVSKDFLIICPILTEIEFKGKVLDAGKEPKLAGCLVRITEILEQKGEDIEINVGDEVIAVGLTESERYDTDIKAGDKIKVYGSLYNFPVVFQNLSADFFVDLISSSSFYLNKVVEEPDLIIQGISWSPSNPKQDDTVTFTVTVKNQGDEDAEKFWVCCNVGTYVPLGYFDHEIPALSAGKEWAFSHTCKISKCGTFEVQAIADFGDSVKESNEDNNVKRETINIQCPPKEKPDLIIQSISVSSSNPKPGDEIEFAVTVKNIGKETAGKSHVFIVGIKKGANKELFRIEDSCSSLKPGEIYTYYKNAKMENCGEYQLMACADATDLVDESNEDNNCRVETVEIYEEKKPDLIIEDITWSPSKLKQGDTITFTVKIKNRGDGNAGTSTVKYYIDGSYVDSDTVPSLSVGSTSTQTFTWTANKCGDVQVKTVADATNAVDESNEDNNEKTKTLTVKCPDLKVESVTYSPEKVHQGTMITVTAKIKNIGDADAEKSNTNIEFTDSAGQSKGGEVVKIGALSVGEETTIEKNYLMQQTGKRIVSVEANYDKAVKESGYSNNKKKVTIEVIGISISVNIYNVNKWRLAWGGEINVKAYDEDDNCVENAEKSFNKVDSVTVSLQVPSNASVIRVFQTPKIKDGVKGYWGSMAIQPTRQTTYEFTRHTSWISDDITINGHSIYSDTINLNEKGNYTIAIPVTNSGYSESSVIVEVLLDRDEKAPWDFRTDDLISINSKEEKDFHFTYEKDKETTGIWRFRAIVKEQYESEGGAIANTDQHAWYLILDKNLIDREFGLGITARYYYEFINPDEKLLTNELDEIITLYNNEVIGGLESEAKSSLLNAIKTYDQSLGQLFEEYGAINDIVEFMSKIEDRLNGILTAANREVISRDAKNFNVEKYSYNLGNSDKIKKDRVDCWKSRDKNEIENLLIYEGQRLAYLKGYADRVQLLTISDDVRGKVGKLSQWADSEYKRTKHLYYDIAGSYEDFIDKTWPWYNDGNGMP